MIEKATESGKIKDDIELLEDSCSGDFYSTELCKHKWINDMYLSKCENRTCCVLQIKKFVLRIRKQNQPLIEIG